MAFDALSALAALGLPAPPRRAVARPEEAERAEVEDDFEESSTSFRFCAGAGLTCVLPVFA
eukprot:49458-Pleurochrysis_carterae.AAC.1